jgi:hypothetical protein
MTLNTVMAGLVPAIYVLLLCYRRKTWMPATSAGMTSGEVCASPQIK